MRSIAFSWVMITTIASAMAQVQSVPVYSSAASILEPLARRERETIHVAFTEYGLIPGGQMMYVRSADCGRTWAPAVPLGSLNQGPATLASSGSHVYMLHGSSFWRSADDGLTWQATPNLTGLAAHAVHATGQQCHAVLTDPTQNPRAVAYMRTVDGGATWSAPQAMGTDTIGHVPQLIVDGSTLHVFWTENNLTRHQRSTDSGATWLAAPHVLGLNAAHGDRVAASGNHIHLLRLANPLEYLRSMDAGASWSPPITVSTQFSIASQLSVAGANVYVTVVGPVFGLPGLVLLRSNDDGATWVGTPNFPGGVIQSSGNVVCAASSGSARTIAISTDAGATWQTHAGGSGTNTAGLGGQPVLSVRPPVISVCWPLRGYFLYSYIWYPTDLDVSGDNGTTWHLRQHFGTIFSSGPASVVDADDASGFLWSNGTSGSGSVVYPTSLHYGTIYGHERFGPSKPGTGGIAPRLAMSSAPRLGNAVTVSLTDTVGGAIAMLGVGFAGEANTPLGSSVLLLATPATGFWGTTTGAAGLAGAGSLALPFAIPSAPSLHGQRVTCQGFALDGNAAEGFASSAGLTMVIL